MPAPLSDAMRAAILRARPGSAAFASGFAGSPAHRRIAAAFDGAADPVAAAAALLDRTDWLDALLAQPIERLRDDPFFDPPLRASRDALRIGAVLFESAGVWITATILSGDAAARAPRTPVCVAPGRISLTRYVRAGGAHLERWHVGPPADPFIAAQAAAAAPLPPMPLNDGQVVVHDGRVEAQRLAGACGDVVMVSIALEAGAAPLVREYAVDGGRLTRVAMLDEWPARAAMMLRLLREQGRRDAGECFDLASRDPAFFLRWEAMREWLTLDVPAALPRLGQMAGDPHPEVAGAAGAMLAPARSRAEEIAALAGGIPCPA